MVKSSSIHRVRALLGSVLIFFLFPSLAAEQTTIPNTKGRVVGENTYENDTLGMTINLPGPWRFLEESPNESGSRESKRDQNSGCTGPLCGEPDVHVALISSRVPPVGAIFLDGYKLSAQYLDRNRYPLKKFAEAMMAGSLGSTKWVPLGEMASIEIDRKPAYRLLVRDSVTDVMKGLGYVGESKTYMFLLVVSTTTPDVVKLQSAIEGLKFH